MRYFLLSSQHFVQQHLFAIQLSFELISYLAGPMDSTHYSLVSSWFDKEYEQRALATNSSYFYKNTDANFFRYGTEEIPSMCEERHTPTPTSPNRGCINMHKIKPTLLHLQKGAQRLLSHFFPTPLFLYIKAVGNICDQSCLSTPGRKSRNCFLSHPSPLTWLSRANNRKRKIFIESVKWVCGGWRWRILCLTVLLNPC